MRQPFLILLLITTCLHSYSRQSHIYTTDVVNFWNAFDQVNLEKDSARRIRIIQEVYLDNGSAGLKDFIVKRHWEAARFVKAIDAYPAFWQSVRAKTMAALSQEKAIGRLFRKYKRLYPKFHMPEIYFVMGYLETGGTTTTQRILLGTEIIAADSTVNATGLIPMLQTFFRSNKGIIPLIAHEVTHTQQKGGDMETTRKSNLLGFCLAEGACEFMAERLTGKALQHPYLTYGRDHEKELWAKFSQAMHGTTTRDWLYNGGRSDVQMADLGYFVGYAICKSYYQAAINKRQAIADIIELDLEDLQALDSFLQRAGYNPQ